MKKPCSHPGCSVLLDHGRYCEKHLASAPKRGESYQRFRRSDPLQRMVDGIRSGAQWQKVRALKLATHPLCEDPFGTHKQASRTVSATQVHHIEGLRDRPDLAHTESNLMSVCTRCHARLEREVRK